MFTVFLLHVTAMGWSV